jgi:hypothetical protein
MYHVYEYDLTSHQHFKLVVLHVISERLMWLYWVYGLAGRMFGIVRYVEQIRVVVLVSLKVFSVSSIQFTLEHPPQNVICFFESDAFSLVRCLMHYWFASCTETTVEVLPRLFKIKFDSGILEELLFVDLPHEYRQSSGHMVLEYGKAIQESVFEQLRVVREGQLRVVFSSELKVLQLSVTLGDAHIVN